MATILEDEMYSVILMTAMTASAPEAPNFGLRGRACWGGGCVGSCYGYSYGYGCSGSCHGCSGGCTGCTGCCGAYVAGGIGHGYAPALVGPGYVGPGYPAPYAGPLPIRIYGPEIWGAHYLYSQSTPFIVATPPDEPKRLMPVPGLGGGARLIIEVPADAKVTIDGRPTQSTSDVRYYYTPKLNDGETYFYDVAVELPGDKPATRRVYVRANEVVRETFKKPLKSSSLARK